MAFQAYISIKGKKQGQFKGEGIQNRRKDKWMPVLAFAYAVQSPRDVATGQASGKRQHKPIVITKEWGPASPQLLQALNSQEALSSVEFQFTKRVAAGDELVYHPVKLTNARILAFGPHRGALPPGASHMGEKYETVTLEYGEEFVTGAGGTPHTPGEVKRFGKFLG